MRWETSSNMTEVVQLALSEALMLLLIGCLITYKSSPVAKFKTDG